MLHSIALKLFGLIVINICLDKTLVCYDQLHNDGVEAKKIIIPTKIERIQWLQSGDYQVRVASENLVFNRFWWWDGRRPYSKMYTNVQIWNASMWIHMRLLEGGFINWVMGVSHMELECHLLEHGCFGMLPKLLFIVDSYKGQHPLARNLPPCIGLDLLWGSNSPRQLGDSDDDVRWQFNTLLESNDPLYHQG